MKAHEFAKEFNYASGLVRVFVGESGWIYRRFKNKSGWSVGYGASLEEEAAVVRDMKDWIEKASGKPLWQALKDGPGVK